MDNATILQYFHWYLPNDGKLWTQVADNARNLAGMGITDVWLPPAHKGTTGKDSIGYDVYDIRDLGEFNQKNSVRTKYGTRKQLEAAAHALHQAGVRVIIDVVLNHMGGADETEKVMVRQVDPEDRNEFISDPFEIEAYTKFTFPGRKGKYSAFEWNFHCFSGIDYAADLDESGIFSIVNNEYGEGWEEMVDDEKGNYDYLMYADIEFRNPYVREELKQWGLWMHDILKFDGVRLDAVKHISPHFYNEWLAFMREKINPELFAVGEYWAPGNLAAMEKYIAATDGSIHLFDASLQGHFSMASKMGKDFDMTTLFDDTLTAARPDLSVSVVANHDTQPLQSLEAAVEPWFKPLAYALILLREQGYPCIFYPDLYGGHYTDKGQDGQDYEIFMPKVAHLPDLIRLRKIYAYGEQKDYLDHPSCIGWTRCGDDDHEGLAVLMSNDQEGFKDMEVGARYAGTKFADALGNFPGMVEIDENGVGNFHAAAGKVSVWLKQ